MTLEEEKELVAEKLGFYFNQTWGTICFKMDESPKSGLLWEHWKPQSERKWWPDIWDKMGYIEERGYSIGWNDYLNNLSKLLEFDSDLVAEKIYKFHTAKPEICWEALIKTLKDK